VIRRGKRTISVERVEVDFAEDFGAYYMLLQYLPKRRLLDMFPTLATRLLFYLLFQTPGQPLVSNLNQPASQLSISPASTIVSKRKGG